jgi:transcriptional regulator with XRE-family HTH domain
VLYSPVYLLTIDGQWSMMGLMSIQTAGTIPPLTLGWRMQMSLGWAKVSVQEMADELGMARNSLSRWLNDHGTPPRSVFLKQWALRTGVDYKWLTTGEEPTSPTGGIGQPEDPSSAQPAG